MAGAGTDGLRTWKSVRGGIRPATELADISPTLPLHSTSDIANYSLRSLAYTGWTVARRLFGFWFILILKFHGLQIWTMFSFSRPVWSCPVLHNSIWTKQFSQRCSSFHTAQNNMGTLFNFTAMSVVTSLERQLILDELHVDVKTLTFTLMLCTKPSGGVYISSKLQLIV